AAEGEDPERASKAKRMLKAFAAEDKTEAKKAEDGEDKKDDKGDDAKSEETAKKSEGGEDEKKAQAALTTLTARLHALEVERAQEKEAKAKAALLDTRTDFSPEVRATLESLPLSTIEQAVKNWK